MHDNPIFPYFFLISLCFKLHYHALAPHPSLAVRASPSLHIVLLFPRCAALLCAVAAAK